MSSAGSAYAGVQYLLVETSVDPEGTGWVRKDEKKKSGGEILFCCSGYCCLGYGFRTPTLLQGQSTCNCTKGKDQHWYHAGFRNGITTLSVPVENVIDRRRGRNRQRTENEKTRQKNQRTFHAIHLTANFIKHNPKSGVVKDEANCNVCSELHT